MTRTGQCWEAYVVEPLGDGYTVDVGGGRDLVDAFPLANRFGAELCCRCPVEAVPRSVRSHPDITNRPRRAHQVFFAAYAESRSLMS